MKRARARVAVALVVLACSAAGCRALVEVFETEPAANGRDGATNPGADARVNCVAWGYIPVHFDPCAIAAPAGHIDLALGNWIYDTNTGTLVHPDFSATFPPNVLLSQPNGPKVRIISVDRFAISAGSQLRIVGVHPLIIAAWQDIRVSGFINVSSAFGEVGAGSNPAVCSSTAAGPGMTDPDGSGGGGGGGFGDTGGDGGDGDTGDEPGGGGGDAAQPPQVVRGGCDGGAGGKDGGGGPAGGAGGGALHIASRTSIRVDGWMYVGGGGGGGGNAGNSGGGGGGSGGYIGIEAPNVRIDKTAIIAANGGGGGGGCESSNASPGEDGRNDTLTANGGNDEGAGTNGGDGGALGSSAGRSASTATTGGGGGGGSVGYIFLHAQTTAIDSEAWFSPQRTEPGWQQ